MFEKEAEEYTIENVCSTCYFEKPCENKCEAFGCADSKTYVLKAFKDGAELGYNKANEWHKVSDKLPEMDELVYLWNKIDDFPVVARRHIHYGHKEWIWDCKWGSGFTVSQLAGEDYLWKEIVLPKE